MFLLCPVFFWAWLVDRLEPYEFLGESLLFFPRNPFVCALLMCHKFSMLWFPNNYVGDVGDEFLADGSFLSMMDSEVMGMPCYPSVPNLFGSILILS